MLHRTKEAQTFPEILGPVPCEEQASANHILDSDRFKGSEDDCIQSPPQNELERPSRYEPFTISIEEQSFPTIFESSDPTPQTQSSKKAITLNTRGRQP